MVCFYYSLSGVPLSCSSLYPVNAVNSVGETPLQLACLRGTNTSVQFLLNNNADVNILNRYLPLSPPFHQYFLNFVNVISKNETALHWAVRRNKPRLVESLMKYGADPFVTSSGQTPMELAVTEKLKDLVSIMQGEIIMKKY